MTMGPIVLIGAFALFLFLTVPIGVSIGLSIIVYFLLFGTQPITFLAVNMFTACDSFPSMAIPFFIAAGMLMEGGGLTKRLVNFAESFVGHFTGGFAIVTVITCMFFGAISGSAPATVAAIGVIMVPAMIERGYSKGFSLALIAAGGCLGVIVPPSIPMVIFGVATGASVGDLFLGGFGPALVFGGALIAFAYIVCRKNGWEGNGEKFSLHKVWDTFTKAIWAIIAPVIILGGIYSGVFTPTEAAAVTVVYSLIVGFFIYKELTIKKFMACFSGSAITVGTILIIVGTGTTLGRVLTVARIPDMVVEGIMDVSINPIVILLLLNLILLVVGCIMETLSAIMILAPILFPVAAAAGMDLVHFGIMMVVNLSIGFITPPVGVNLFVACGLRKDVTFGELCKRIWPMIIVLVAALLVITFVPAITMWLPSLMG